jgi:hypothetical protein
MGCDKRTTIDQQELRSEIKSAISLVSEAQLFVEHVERNKTSRDFRAAHAAYLIDLSNQYQHKLTTASAIDVAPSIVPDQQEKLSQFTRELILFQNDVPDISNLEMVKRDLAAIQSQMQVNLLRL